MLRRAACPLSVAIIGVIVLSAAVIPGTGAAARLVGGREQAAVLHAFARAHGTRQALATSVRAATVSPAWVVVRWVVPATGNELRPPSPTLHSTYFHVTGGRVAAGSPPASAARDLSAPFSVAVLYTGSGTETIHYLHATRSICVGNGSYVDTQVDSITPMRWTVRYVVGLDRLQTAVTDGGAAALLPAVGFDRARSALSAAEQLSRGSVDQGCFGPTRTAACSVSFSLRTPGAESQLGLGPAGLQVGIPMNAGHRGDCAPEDYVLGRSLWDNGGATAAVGRLSLTGGRLPPNPYAPVRVAWPVSSAGAVQGTLISPCQGSAECTDMMRWTGTVRLQALGR